MFGRVISELLESTEDSVELLAHMSFLLPRIHISEIKAIVDSEMEGAVNSNIIQSINNIAAFCIYNHLKIPIPEKVIRALLAYSQYKNNLLSILTFMKYNQANDYIAIIESFGNEIDFRLEKNTNDIQEDDARSIKVVLRG